MSMKTYNVLVPVVELVLAASEEEAIEKLTAKIKRSGLDVYEGGPFNAFESEDDAPAVIKGRNCNEISNRDDGGHPRMGTR